MFWGGRELVKEVISPSFLPSVMWNVCSLLASKDSSLSCHLSAHGPWSELGIPVFWSEISMNSICAGLLVLPRHFFTIAWLVQSLDWLYFVGPKCYACLPLFIDPSTASCHCLQDKTTRCWPSLSFLCLHDVLPYPDSIHRHSCSRSTHWVPSLH